VCDVQRPRPRRMRSTAVLRSAALYCGLWLILAPGFLAVADFSSGRVKALLWGAGIVLVLLATFLRARSEVTGEEPLVLAPPVRGCWMAINSPATGIPSHGTYAFGQTFAVDLIASPRGQARQMGNGARGAFVPPEEFPSFSEPVYAIADAAVVRVHDQRPDHKSRSSKIALVYFAFESFIRSLGPPSFLLGNHVILRLQDGSHILYAHLRRGSFRVAGGDTVKAGDLIAECGNSGNSTLPHLHIQRQDVPSVLGASGLPWAIAGVGKAGAPGFPRSGEIACFGCAGESGSGRNACA
jgi:Peptidase family M23